jgi:hypothetical protein
VLELLRSLLSLTAELLVPLFLVATELLVALLLFVPVLLVSLLLIVAESASVGEHCRDGAESRDHTQAEQTFKLRRSRDVVDDLWRRHRGRESQSLRTQTG